MKIKELRFRRFNFIMPMVYNDAISYSELVYKMLSKQNEIIDAVNAISSEEVTGNNILYVFPKNTQNVLQGDCNLITYADKSIMIDAHLAGAHNTVLEMLNYADVEHLDYFILTHYHIDHFGGMQQLINDGYIDANTTVYLPAETSLVNSDQSLHSNMIQVKSWLIESNVPYKVPSIGEQIVIDDFKLTFYNCASTMTYANYNNQSTICLIELGAHRSLFTGDCYSTPLGDLVKNGYINDHINLYKVGHHGINAGSDQNLGMFFNIISPDYSVTPSSLLGAEQNLFHNGQQTGILQSIGSKMYPVAYNSELIVFGANSENTWSVNGHSVESVSSQRYIQHVYVSKDDAGSTQYGTEDYPYSSVEQAIASCDFDASTDYRIHIKHSDSGYGSEHETVGKNTISLFGASITLERWGNDAVTLNCFMVAMFSDIRIRNINFSAQSGGVEGTLIFRGCNVTLENVTVNNNNFTGVTPDEESDTSETYMSGVYLYHNCSCRLDNVSVTNAEYGVSINSSDLFALNTVFNNCSRGWTVALASVFGDYNTTYTDVTTQKVIRNGSYDLSSVATTALATTTSNGLMSAEDKTNLNTLMSDYQSASTALG